MLQVCLELVQQDREEGLLPRLQAVRLLGIRRRVWKMRGGEEGDTSKDSLGQRVPESRRSMVDVFLCGGLKSGRQPGAGRDVSAPSRGGPPYSCDACRNVQCSCSRTCCTFMYVRTYMYTSRDWSDRPESMHACNYIYGPAPARPAHVPYIYVHVYTDPRAGTTYFRTWTPVTVSIYR